MARIHLSLTFVVLVISNQAFLSNGNPLIIPAIDKVLQIYGMISGLQGAVSSLYGSEETPQFYYKLSEELQKISRGLSDFRNEYKTNSELMQQTLIRKFQVHGEFHTALTALRTDYLNVIKSRYERFAELYLRSNDAKTITSVERFFRDITGEDESGLDFKLKMMYLHVKGPQKSDNIFNLMNRQLQEVELDRCDDPVSSQKYIYNLFADIVIHELDAFIMIVTGYSYLQKQAPSAEYENGINIVINGTRERLIGYTREAREVMAKASRFVFRCGPTGRDFFEVKGLTQAILIDDKKWNFVCKDDKRCTPKGAHPAGQNICDGNKCLGLSCYSELTNCQSLASTVEVCRPNGRSNRRYNYLKYSDFSLGHPVEVYSGKKLEGSSGSCQREHAKYYGYDAVLNSCTFCMCTCTDNGWRASDVRTIYHNVWSVDTANSKAVIGVRFVEENGMIHLQLKQGTLLPYGKILNGSEEWKPIPKIRRVLSTDPKIPHEFYYVDTNEKLREFYDFYHITNLLKTMSLSDVKLPDGYIVTGAGFTPGRRVNLGSRTTHPFEIVLVGTPYDFKTGKYVTGAKSEITTIPATDVDLYKGGDRAAIQFEEPDVPSRSPKNTVYPGSDQIVTFNITDYKKDAGQTMIPFFDAQEVVTTPSAPLSGIGMYFKGKSGYGGFIAPRVLLFDMNDKIDNDFEKFEVSRDTGKVNDLINDYNNRRQ